MTMMNAANFGIPNKAHKLSHFISPPRKYFWTEEVKEEEEEKTPG